MPYLRPRNNIILPKEVHEGILWKEEKAIRKAQLASLLENQKSKRKYIKSTLTSSSVETKLSTTQSVPSSSRNYAKYVKSKSLRKATKLKSFQKNNIFLSHTSSISHRRIVRYSLSPEYLANHKLNQNQTSHCSASEKSSDTLGIVDEENLTPTKTKMYLAQRKFAQNDHQNTMVHDATLSNPLHASPNLMEVLADRPGVIQNGRTISIIRENSGQNLDHHEPCGSGASNNSVIRRAPVCTPIAPVTSVHKRKSRPDPSPKISATRLKLRPAGGKEEKGEGTPIDTLDTTDFLSWLYMRHLPEMPPHLKDVDNYMKTFLAQKVPNA